MSIFGNPVIQKILQNSEKCGRKLQKKVCHTQSYELSTVEINKLKGYDKY